MTAFGVTPSQTVGPFFLDCLMRRDGPGNVLAAPGALGERIWIEGRVLDGAGEPVSDALVEVWQANAAGRYHHPADTRALPLDPAFTGFGRCATDAQGCYRFDTIRPGSVPAADGNPQAAHLSLVVMARGLLNHLYSRCYFSDDPALGDDPVLRSVPEQRRSTLVAVRLPERAATPVYRFDIVLQGTAETVFFRW